MKRLLDPAQLRSYRDRGRVRTPDGLARFLDGRPGAGRSGDPFPHPRFWLWMEMWCPTLVGQQHPYDFVDIQVWVFYEGVLPWLAYGLDGATALQRGRDLVDLTDELMDNEYDWYACSMAWPLAEVLAVFADVFTALYFEQPRDLVVAWDMDKQTWLRQTFGEMTRALEAHESCCAEIRVNVHWW